MLIIQLLHLLLLLKSSFISFPEFYIYPYLTHLGFLPYRQIIDHHFPGLNFFTVNFYTLGFRTPESFHILLVLIIFLQSIFVVKIIRYLSSFPHAGLVVSVFFMLWQLSFAGNQLWFETFITLFTLPAFLFFLRREWFLCGLFLSLGLVIKQSIAPLVLVAMGYIYYYDHLKVYANLIKFITGLSIPLLFTFIYFYCLGVWSDFFYWNFIFNLFAYSHSALKLPTFRQLLFLSIPGLIIISSLFIKKLRSSGLVLCCWLVGSIILGVSRFEILHLQPAVPFLSLISSLFFIYLYTAKTNKLYLHLFLFLVLIVYINMNRLFNSPDLFFNNQTSSLTQIVSQYAVPGDSIFLLGVQPHIYALTQTQPSGRYFSWQLPWLYKETLNSQLAALRSDPPRLVLLDPSASVDNLPIRTYAPALVSYVENNFIKVDTIDGIDLYLPITKITAKL